MSKAKKQDPQKPIDEKAAQANVPAPQAESEVGEATPSQAACQSAGEEYSITQEQASELKQRFHALQKQCDDYLLTAQRIQAEFDNFRKRTATTRAESLSEGTRDAVKNMLAAMDSLERAVDACAEQPSALSDGVALVLRQFLDGFDKLGVYQINPLGAPFDPNFADAVMSEPKEDVEAGIVIEVFQKGYIQGEKVIRPAMVKVSN